MLDEEVDSQNEPGVTKRHVLARIIANEMLRRTRGGHSERKLYMDREWPVVRHHRIAPDVPYPDLSGLSDLELRTVTTILRKARTGRCWQRCFQALPVTVFPIQDPPSPGHLGPLLPVDPVRVRARSLLPAREPACASLKCSKSTLELLARSLLYEGGEDHGDPFLEGRARR